MSIEAITKESPFQEADYRVVEADINFLGEQFEDGMEYPSDLKFYGELTSTNIRLYSSVDALVKKYTLSENGFQYLKLDEDDPLSKAMERYAKSDWFYSLKEKSQLLDLVQQSMVSWGKKNGIPGIPFIRDTVYRNSNPNSYGQPPFFLAHVDYSKEDAIDPMSNRGKWTRHKVEEVFGKMSDEEYKKVKHHFLLNVWMPLHEDLSHNTLALLNTKSVKDLPQKLRPVSTNAGISFSLHPSKKQEWVAKDLTLKDRTVILFHTDRTPHTAINIKGVSKSPRRSIEFRVLFVSLVEEQNNAKVLLLITFIVISCLALADLTNPKDSLQHT